MEKVIKSDQKWREELSPELYHIAREKGTEPPFTGKYLDFQGEGRFLCSACGQELFSAEAKYSSGTGWPSFSEPISKENIEEFPDKSLGMNRTEVVCARCNAHIGHVFNDGPQPTGLRYCINSISLKLAE